MLLLNGARSRHRLLLHHWCKICRLLPNGTASIVVEVAQLSGSSDHAISEDFLSGDLGGCSSHGHPLLWCDFVAKKPTPNFMLPKNQSWITSEKRRIVSTTYENYLETFSWGLEKMRPILPEKRLTHCLGVEKAARDLAKQLWSRWRAGWTSRFVIFTQKLSDQEFLDLIDRYELDQH